MFWVALTAKERDVSLHIMVVLFPVRGWDIALRVLDQHSYLPRMLLLHCLKQKQLSWPKLILQNQLREILTFQQQLSWPKLILQNQLREILTLIVGRFNKEEQFLVEEHTMVNVKVQNSLDTIKKRFAGNLSTLSQLYRHHNTSRSS